MFFTICGTSQLSRYEYAEQIRSMDRRLFVLKETHSAIIVRYLSSLAFILRSASEEMSAIIRRSDIGKPWQCYEDLTASCTILKHQQYVDQGYCAPLN